MFINVYKHYSIVLEKGVKSMYVLNVSLTQVGDAKLGKDLDTLVTLLEALDV